MIRLTWIVLIIFLLGGCSLIKGGEEIPPTRGSRKPQKEVLSAYDNGAFVADVTIPDGAAILPGGKFEKVWRIRNTGTTIWKDYRIVFIRGDLMGAPSEAPVPETPPGGEADIKIPMKAPERIGSYSSFWKMKNNRNISFGDTLWVNIKAKD